MKIHDSRHFKFGILIAINFILIHYGCDKTEETDNKAPTCSITSPDNGEEIQQGEIVTISVDANDTDGNVNEVRFYVDGTGVGFSSSFPYNYDWNTSGETTGSHTLKASVKNDSGESASDEIAIFLTEGGSSGNEPVAAFTASQTSVNPGSSVQFTEQSTNSPTSWSWDFGDGGTSTSQNTSHSYSSTGNYNVSLTATNSYGSDTETKTNYITVTTSSGETGTVSDYDGNTYNTIKIGNQWWMAEDLKTTRYSNGTSIPLIENTTDWGNLGYEDKAMCYYDNSSTNSNTYGVLYTWAAAMNGANSSSSNLSNVQGVCPSGWHLPSDAEWTELTDYLGGSSVAGGKMKETGTTHWYSPNTGATNESGFTALPGRTRNYNGVFYSLGSSVYFWSATETDASYTNGRGLYYGISDVRRYDYRKTYGFSARCIKDN